MLAHVSLSIRAWKHFLISTKCTVQPMRMGMSLLFLANLLRKILRLYNPERIWESWPSKYKQIIQSQSYLFKLSLMETGVWGSPFIEPHNVNVCSTIRKIRQLSLSLSDLRSVGQKRCIAGSTSEQLIRFCVAAGVVGELSGGWRCSIS